jgi:hypothetical protein
MFGKQIRIMYEMGKKKRKREEEGKGKEEECIGIIK